jgi:hypothetical protein
MRRRVNRALLDAMILLSNLPRLRELAGAAGRVLDVGGWYQPFNLATHVVDLMPCLPTRARTIPSFAVRRWRG